MIYTLSLKYTFPQTPWCIYHERPPLQTEESIEINNKILQEKPDQLKKMLGLTNTWLMSESVQDKEKYFKTRFKYALTDAERT